MDELSPSAIILGALLAGFVLYLAKSNRLAVYYGLLFGGGTTGSTSSSSGNTLNDWLTTLGLGTGGLF